MNAVAHAAAVASSEIDPGLLLALAALQICLGLAIVLGALLLGASAVDRRTRWAVSWPLSGLAAWGTWFALVPFARGPDSLPALALAGLVAYVLIRHNRAVVDRLGLNREE